MTTSQYIENLRKKQLLLLKEYNNLISKALSEGFLCNSAALQAYKQHEDSYLHRYEHLEKVIRAFPDYPSTVDNQLQQQYLLVSESLDQLKKSVKQYKNKLRLRERNYLRKGNRQKRLYRELKPAYIDIHT